MRIPDPIRKCVLYLGLEVSEGLSKKIVYCGTGFVVSVPSNIEGFSFGYLVTAKHVAVQLIKGNGFFIRANSREGKSIDVKADGVQWWFHPTDTSADVAIFTFGATVEKLDFSAIPISMFLAQADIEPHGIGAGDEVFITGLFVHHKGTAKNIPIIRTGNIAMIPDEPIPTTFGDMDAYLIEARSIGGLSGSPVFVIKPVYAIDQEKIITARMYLMGLIHGHWDVKPETIIDTIAQDANIKAGINVGIAIVAPAQKILDVINRDELMAFRNRTESEHILKKTP